MVVQLMAMLVMFALAMVPVAAPPPSATTAQVCHASVGFVLMVTAYVAPGARGFGNAKVPLALTVTVS